MQSHFLLGRTVRTLVPVFSALAFLPFLCLAQSDLSQPHPPADGMAPTGYTTPAGAGNMAQLLDHLHLSPEQMPLWDAYSARVAAYTRLYYEEKPASAYVGDSGARQVGRLVDLLQNRLAALEDVESAARVLYAGLNPVQKKLADTALLDSVPVFNTLGVSSCPATGTGAGGARKDGGGRGPGGGGMGGGMGSMGGMSGSMGGAGGF